VINTNLLPILHHFRDIAFDKSKTPLAFNPPDGGVPTSYHRISDTSLKLDSLGYIPVAKCLRKSSTAFTQCAPKATKFAEITLNNGHYAVQGH